MLFSFPVILIFILFGLDRFVMEARVLLAVDKSRPPLLSSPVVYFGKIDPFATEEKGESIIPYTMHRL